MYQPSLTSQENSHGNDTKLSLISAGKTLFWKFGIKKVSVEEIAKEAGVSKMTFYRNFSNKEELAERVLSIEHMSSRAGYRKIMSEDIPFRDKIEQFITKQNREVRSMSNMFFNDTRDGKLPKLNSLVKRNTDQLISDLMRDITKAQESGEVRKSMNPEFILYLMNDLSRKFDDPEIIGLYKNRTDLSADLTDFFFQGILA